MNSLFNAASSVSEAIWGKSGQAENASGEEPPHEAPAGTETAATEAAAPYDPGNTVDTAPAPTTTAPPQDSAGDGTPTAIPAPGNAEQAVTSPTEGAGPTQNNDSEVAKKEETATTGAIASTEEGKEAKKTLDTEAPKTETSNTEPDKKETKADEVVESKELKETKESKESKEIADGQKTPPKKTTAAAAAAAASTPPRGRSDSPTTPGSGKRGLRTKLKEKLHIGSQSPSGRKKE